MDEVSSRPDLAVRLPNRPGSMAAVCEALGRAGINIDGICEVIEGGIDIDHFVMRSGHAMPALNGGVFPVVSV